MSTYIDDNFVTIGLSWLSVIPTQQYFQVAPASLLGGQIYSLDALEDQLLFDVLDAELAVDVLFSDDIYLQGLSKVDLLMDVARGYYPLQFVVQHLDVPVSLGKELLAIFMQAFW